MIIELFLGVAQLVARYLGVVEAGCSSHLTQTSGVAPTGSPYSGPLLWEGALHLREAIGTAWGPGFVSYTIKKGDNRVKVEMTFNDAAITAGGYQKADIFCAIKAAFAKCGLICLSESDVLSFEDAGQEDDYAHIWNVIKSLMISDWFLKCASSCVFVDDEDVEEDVLSQAYLFKKRTAV